MKNLLIFEYITSNPSKFFLKNQVLLEEGIKMIDKLSFDFQKSIGIKKISVIRNTKLNFKKYKNINYFLTNKRISWLDILKNLDIKKTKVLLIAPETNNIISSVLKIINSLGFEVLCSDTNTIIKFRSKFSTYNNLKKKKIPCVKSFKKISEVEKKKLKYIVKPNISSGSENVFLAKNYKELSRILKKTNFSYVIQYYKPKMVGSFSMICLKGKSIVLACNKQIVSKKKRISQIGSFIGKYEKYRQNFIKIANLISKSFPGLYGYVGVDVVFEDNMWKVIEINPRFTTSYVGLEKVYGGKINRMIIDLYTKNKIKLNKLVDIKKSRKLIFK